MAWQNTSGNSGKALFGKMAALASCVVLALSFALAGCASSSGKSSGESSSGSSSAQSAAESSSSSAESQASDAKYAVTIDSMTLSKDYQGANTAIVTYTWTNNSDKATSFMVAVSANAYQNGVQLESAIGAEGADSSATMKELKPGATTTVQRAYVLDDSSDVTVEVTETFSFSDEVIAEKTFTVA